MNKIQLSMNTEHIAKVLHTIVAILLIGSFNSTVLAQIDVVADRPTATYEVGELMNFNVLSDYTGTATYTIKLDARSHALEEGTIELVAGQTVQIPFSYFEPAFLLCEVQGAISTIAGAAVSPFELQPMESEPTDFDQFWAQQKNALAAVPISPAISPYSSTSKSDTYQLSLGNIEGRRVHGFISVPKGNGPFPAFLTMPSYGSGGGHVFPREFDAEILNSIIVVLSIHNAPADQGDPNAYKPDDYTDQYKNYYRYGLLGGVQAINYLFTRPDFDKQNLGVMGISQGGGLSISMAGLDDRIKLLVASVPALCHHAGFHYDRTSGHPHYLFSSRNTYSFDPSHEQNALKATRYFDAVYFAKRFKGPSILFVSYEDDVCPPSSVMTAANQLTNRKIIFNRRESGHSNPDYWDKRFEFIRSIMPQTKNTLTNNAPVNTGYYTNINASSTSTGINQSIQLSAEIFLDDVRVDLPVSWDKHSGPGRVNFTSTKSGITSVSFSTPGTYVIKFTAEDTSFLNTDDKWISLTDHLTIIVQ